MILNVVQHHHTDRQQRDKIGNGLTAHHQKIYRGDNFQTKMVQLGYRFTELIFSDACDFVELQEYSLCGYLD